VTPARKPVPMCCVTIDHNDFLLPVDKGMKLVELMQHAVACYRNYEEHGYRYAVRETPSIELTVVKPSQIVMPRDAQPQPALEGPRG
jgi:hypothetical protein